jgi:uncharacterized membrane protein YhhN
VRRSTAAYAVLAAVDTGLAAGGRRRERRLTKPLLMPVLALAADAPTRRALGLSGAGDVALLGGSDGAFTGGLAAFLASHVAWVAALRGRGGGGVLRRRPLLGAPHVAAWAVLNAVLWPRTGRDRVPVVVYSTALLAMALTALDTGDRRAAAGGALFLLSDGLLALERFAGVALPAHEGLVMASYTSAQALLAAGGRT